jgi:LysM repeat protein
MNLFSQEKFKKHTVSKGETISEIAQKYNVKSSTIYELNPDAINGLKLKMVLLIPLSTKQNTSVAAPVITSNLPEKTHEVLPKETLYGVAKQYNITIEDLYKINPNLEKEGLKIGQSIKVPQTVVEDLATAKEVVKFTSIEKANVAKKDIPKEEIEFSPKTDKNPIISTEVIEHEVLPKESFYLIAKRYGIKLADLQKVNPELANKPLKVGQKIAVPIRDSSKTTVVSKKSPSPEKYQKEEIAQTSVSLYAKVENKKVAVEKTINVVSENSNDSNKSKTDISHEVIRGESFYSIAKKYDITLSDLRKANAELGNKS